MHTNSASSLHTAHYKFYLRSYLLIENRVFQQVYGASVGRSRPIAYLLVLDGQSYRAMGVSVIRVKLCSRTVALRRCSVEVRAGIVVGAEVLLSLVLKLEGK